MTRILAALILSTAAIGAAQTGLARNTQNLSGNGALDSPVFAG